MSTFAGSLFGQVGAAGPAEIVYDFASPIDASSFTHVSFRIAKVQCNNRDHTGAIPGDGCCENVEMDGLGVSVEVRGGVTARAVVVTNPDGTASLPGRRVHAPWSFFDGTAFSTASFSVPNTVRVPRACFGTVPAGFWSSLSSVRIRVGNASEHAVLSDISLAR